eukprot:Lithocolla_globosa_v1_NODE_881_length_3142_cov_19.214772.p3 type:complete len:111 gc:universal NODE_881_length_3142_cov_19.214772:1985-1653(-)
MPGMTKEDFAHRKPCWRATCKMHSKKKQLLEHTHTHTWGKPQPYATPCTKTIHKTWGKTPTPRAPQHHTLGPSRRKHTPQKYANYTTTPHMISNNYYAQNNTLPCSDTEN